MIRPLWDAWLAMLREAPMPFDAVELHRSKVRVKTPREPRTGVRDLLMDPLDGIHAVTLQVPDPRRHLVRYFGVHANRPRRLRQGRASGLGWGATPDAAGPPPAEGPVSPGGTPAPARAAGPVCSAGVQKWIRSSAHAAGWR